MSALAVPLDRIGPCLEGVIPSPLCTCSAAGVPNITYLSIVRMVDADHVGLSFQFFSKTRQNFLENPRAQVLVVNPCTMQQYRLDVRFERSETEGPLFESMRTQLCAIASQTGMDKVFVLRGVDVCRVLACDPIGRSEFVDSAAVDLDPLAALDGFSRRIAACPDLDSLYSGALQALEEVFGYPHSFLLLPDEDGQRLFTIASRGYAASGVGSEVMLGEGLLGVAARRRTIVRNTNLARDLLMSRAVRTSVEVQGDTAALGREISLPGLPSVISQLVVPLVAQDQLLGLLCLQSPRPGRFLAKDAQLVEIAARHLASSLAWLQAEADRLPEAPHRLPAPAPPDGGRASVKYYASDDSVFIDDSYVVKGVAGRILWMLVKSHVEERRCEFSNKQIRLDASLRLPEFKDNLETRLILLRRRLEERSDFLRIVRTGRGRFQFQVGRSLALEAFP